MEARSTLLVAGAFAVPTAILAGPCLPAAAAIAVLALAVALRWRNRPACGAALCAMPVLFAALPAGGAQAAGSGEPDWPRPGPVRLAGTV
ncbi:MAG: hypothetical protein KDE27_09205, partial [Planctomycetes bacterium]|nr:hypothetical protein [Planctomycetota bacterium]